MQNWFSTFQADEVETLPSWSLIFENIKEWNEVSKQLHGIESEFQVPTTVSIYVLKLAFNICKLRVFQ